MASTNLSKDRSAIYFGQHWAQPYRTAERQSRNRRYQLSVAS